MQLSWLLVCDEYLLIALVLAVVICVEPPGFVHYTIAHNADREFHTLQSVFCLLYVDEIFLSF